MPIVAEHSNKSDRIREIEIVAREQARRGPLDEARSPAAIVLAASNVVMSLLGAHALRQAGWTILAGLAVLAFTVALAVAAGILWPV